MATMENLFIKLGIPSEESKVKMSRCILLPYIQTRLALQATHTISELVKLSRAIEETIFNVFALHQQTIRFSYSHSWCTENQLQPLQVIHRWWRLLNANRYLRSWLCCQGSGHRFRNYPKPGNTFCFKCGKENVISLQCCHRNGRKRGHN